MKEVGKPSCLEGGGPEMSDVGTVEVLDVADGLPPVIEEAPDEVLANHIPAEPSTEQEVHS
jgi:hypothetical protein